MESFSITNYPYLILGLVLLMLFAAGLILSSAKQRWPMVVSGLLLMPCSFASIVFVPEYWNPVRIVTFLTGPEDLLFAFTTGGIVWLLATWSLRNYIDLELQPRLIIRRYLIVFLIGLSVSAMSLLAGFGVMISAIFGILSVGIFILCLRKNLWPIQCIGMISFIIFYLIIIKVGFMVFPEFLQQWTAKNLWGPDVWGVPLDEIAWAAAFGAVWPLIIAYLFDARLVPYYDTQDKNKN